ncbi:hypothetical protein K3X41_11215 [Aliiroseovarius crassostreae]|uniref:hypothetical protein n=1 Tax=Aliiroseovarius crassostreae TaxID=154981 RepID=UPI0021FC1350|nr:hypothetical protein [Aliiroseovarius crassostreae]UWQ10465.1 hypothetical protein K3X41_11215 [Aliiroseovarius crassostreae]
MSRFQIAKPALSASLIGGIASALVMGSAGLSQEATGQGYVVNRSAAFAPALAAYEAELAQDCAAFEKGELHINPGGLQTVADFNGDGITDPVLDTGVYSCSSMASFNQGSGGRVISVFVSDQKAEQGYHRFEFLGEGNVTVSLGDRAILLLAQHGSGCGRSGAEICFGAYSWSEGAFISLGGEVTPVR